MNDFESQKDIKAYYDKSEYFEEKNKFKDLENQFQKYRISKVFQIYIPTKNDNVLDIGCGWGTFCFAISPICKEVTGIDYSRKSIDICERLSKNYKYVNIRFICADAQSTELKQESYDVIICADLFEHLYPEVSEKVLDECRRLLKKKGKLVIWTPNRGHILEILKNRNIILKKDISHVDYKSMDRLIEILTKRNFLIKKCYYVESHIPIFSSLEKILLGILPFMRRRIAILAEKN